MILIDEKPLFDETYDLLKARLFEDLSDSLRAQFQERGGFVHLKQLKELIVGSGDTVFRVDHRGAWAGAANFNDAPFKVEMNGVITCSDIVVIGGTIDGVVITGLGAGSEIAIQGWQQDMAWSAIDHDTVAWAVGTITLLDGTTYNIAGGDTGTMSAITYIYLDIAVSTTALRTTDTPATAIGSGKILIAVAQNVASGNSAIFQVFGGKALGGVGKLIVAPDIVANVITGNEIYGNTLAAIFADLGAIIAGNITLDASGYIKGGQTAFDTGDQGFWFGYVDSAWKFSMAATATQRLIMDNSGLVFAGKIKNLVGDILMKSGDTEKEIPTGSYQKLKEIRFTRGGAYRIKFDMKNNNTESTMYAQVYRNGVAVGTEQSIVGSIEVQGIYYTFSEDISGWTAGDLCQLYAKYSPDAGGYIKNFRIYVQNCDEPELTLD